MTSAVLNNSKNEGPVLLPSGEGGAEAPDEGSPPHDFVDLQNRGAGRPHPALRATLSQWERAAPKPRSRFF
jgi:hypothetical protein